MSAGSAERESRSRQPVPRLAPNTSTNRSANGASPDSEAEVDVPRTARRAASTAANNVKPAANSAVDSGKHLVHRGIRQAKEAGLDPSEVPLPDSMLVHFWRRSLQGAERGRCTAARSSRRPTTPSRRPSLTRRPSSSGSRKSPGRRSARGRGPARGRSRRHCTAARKWVI